MVQTHAKHKAAPPHYEFGGPLGALGITIGLPILCYAFTYLCNDVSGCPSPSLLHPSSVKLSALAREVAWPGFTGLLNTRALLVTLGYYATSLILYRVLPAQEQEGTELRSGGRILYRLNAFNSAAFILCTLAAFTLTGKSIHDSKIWPWIWDNYPQLLTSSILIAYGLAFFVYVRSFSVQNTGHRPPGRPKAHPPPTGPSSHRELAAHGTTGNIPYDFYIGRELNPPLRIPLIGDVELKSFMELRPGMLGWLILDLAFAVRQHRYHGTVTDSMLIVVLSQAVYIFDALLNESAILTTMDITTDGFGFMLAFGDLVWVPFVYSLQTRYLAVHPVHLGPLYSAAILSLLALGYYIFRSANSQKNAFRTDPSDPAVAHLSYIQTARGSRLLTSGWWGAARHINYLGDWLLSWAYCLPTLLAGYEIVPSSPFRDHPQHSDSRIMNSALIPDNRSLRGGVEVIPGEAEGWGMLVTYFYMVYFAVLLVHRERRDEEKCRKKYGRDWEEYCRRVPSRIVPGIY